MEADPLDTLDANALREIAAHATPELAPTLEAMAEALERGESLEPQTLGVEPQELLSLVQRMLPRLRQQLGPLERQLSVLQEQVRAIAPLRAESEARLQVLMQHIDSRKARTHTAQALAQLQSTVRPERLTDLLNELQNVTKTLPQLLEQASSAYGTPPDLQLTLARLETLQEQLTQTQTGLHGASASLGFAATAAMQDQDPTTPLLLALRAGIVQALDGQAIDAWTQAFDAATHFRNRPVAQGASVPLMQQALESQDYQRAALIQHLLAELSPESQRFDHRLQEALLLSKIGGFQDSIRALLSECASLADGIPQRARLQLTQGEILERLGDLKGAQRSWTKLIDLPNVQNEAPALQARGLAFLGEALLSESAPKASPLLEAAIDRGEAAGDWSAVGYAAQALLPLLREQDPNRASDLAERLRDIAGRLQPEALPALDQWLG